MVILRRIREKEDTENKKEWKPERKNMEYVKDKEEGDKERKDRYQKRKRKRDLDFEKPKSINNLDFRHGNQ